MDDFENIIADDVVDEKKQKHLEQKQEKMKENKQSAFKTKECKVIKYDNVKNILDINFDGFGIRIENVKDFSGDTVKVKYKGEIGKPNFVYEL